jgi:hypothetical protein
MPPPCPDPYPEQMTRGVRVWAREGIKHKNMNNPKIESFLMDCDII